MKKKPKLRKGFAAMEAGKQRIIASMGGKAQGKKNNPGNFANNRERAVLAGRKGGMSQGKHNNPTNFAHSPERAAEAGRKGGAA